MNIKKTIQASLRQNSKIIYTPVGITLLLGLVLAIMAFKLVRTWEEHEIRLEFDQAVENRISAFKRSLGSNLLVLESLGGLYAASHEVDRREFREFVTPVFSQNLSIQALEWIPRVPASERSSFEKAAQMDGFPQFQITERQAQGKMVSAAQRVEYFPVYFVEPIRGNEPALGFDLASNPTREEALSRSRESGKVVATARITLVQEKGEQFGFLVFRPVYQKGKPLNSPAARKKYLEGFVLGVFRIGDIVERALGDLAPAGIDIFLQDLSAEVNERFLHFHSARTRESPVAWGDAEELVERAKLRHAHTFNVAGREWSIVCAATPGFIAARKTLQPWGVLSLSLLCSAILVIYFFVNIRHQIKLSETYQSLEIEIVERRRAEEELRDTNEKLQALIKASPVAITLLDKEGKVTLWSPAAEKIFGWSEEEVIGRRLPVVPKDKDAEFEQNLEIVLGGQSITDLELSRQKKDGSQIDISLAVAPLLNKEGETYGVAGIMTDISERKRAREEQQRLEAQLQHAQKLEAVGTLAGGIAHDFNNLLQAVQGYAEILLLDKEEGDPGHRGLREIVRAAKRGGELTQQLLAFSRKIESKLRPVDLNMEVDKMRKMLERTTSKMIEIELRLAAGLKIVNADPTQIEQILVNLAVNAKEAMPDGGKLLIQTENVMLDEDYCRTHAEARPGEYVLLRISDKGHGMDKETLENIFDPFYTTKGFAEGTGLGLAMVYGIVKSHGGLIECSSELGRGTTFKIYLPITEQEIESEKATVTDMSKKGGTETILLVDDEDFIRNVGERTFTKFGYSVLNASDGKNALELYRKEQDQIGLVILDLMMPGMNGRRCLEELLKVNPQAKIIVASGYSDIGPMKESIEAGAKSFIGKPYQMRQLLKLVRDVLDEG